jgi:hypothetical protein
LYLGARPTGLADNHPLHMGGRGVGRVETPGAARPGINARGLELLNWGLVRSILPSHSCNPSAGMTRYGPTLKGPWAFVGLGVVLGLGVLGYLPAAEGAQK